MREKKPPAFQVYLDTYEHIKSLNMAERGELFTALFEYAVNGINTDFENGAVAMAFSFMRAQIDRDFIKYEKRCATNRENASKRQQPKATANDR